MNQFKIGDKVRFKDTIANVECHKTEPLYYPLPNTLGTVLFVAFNRKTKEVDSLRVCWEGNANQYCFIAPMQVVLVEE